MKWKGHLIQAFGIFYEKRYPKIWNFVKVIFFCRMKKSNMASTRNKYLTLVLMVIMNSWWYPHEIYAGRS
jgi:hypothetical protein